MLPYLFVVLAIANRVFLASGSHAGHPWWNFTAVGGSLLFFGAQKPLKYSWIPLLALAATDALITHYAYSLPFSAVSILFWAWYAVPVLLGAAILRNKASVARVVGSSVGSATSFFLVSNFVGFYPVSMYSHTLQGMLHCYTAGLPFFANDLLSTTATLGLAYGTLALVHSREKHQAAEARVVA